MTLAGLYECPEAGDCNLVFDGINTYQAIGFLEEDGSLSGLDGRKKRRAKRKARKAKRKKRRKVRKVKRKVRRRKVFKKIGKGFKKVGKVAYKVVKKVVPIAAAIAPLIPIIGAGAGLVLSAADAGIQAREKRLARKKLTKRNAERAKRLKDQIKQSQSVAIRPPQTKVSKPSTIRAVKQEMPVNSGQRTHSTSPFVKNRQKSMLDLFKIFDMQPTTRSVYNAEVERATLRAMRG